MLQNLRLGEFKWDSIEFKCCFFMVVFFNTSLCLLKNALQSMLLSRKKIENDQTLGILR